jgi:uridine kinase
MKPQTTIQYTDPRDTIEVHLPDGRIITGPRGATLEDLFSILNGPDQAPIVGGIVNGKLGELSQTIDIDVKARPVRLNEPDGKRFYRRSLTFLLERAFHDIHPEVILNIDHSISSGGYFCQVYRRSPLSDEELQVVEDRMRELVEEDIPFERTRVSLKEGIQLFEKWGYKDKVRLLVHRKKDYLTLYSLGDHLDYHHGYMVPSTGYLQWFDLEPMDEGFILRFPRQAEPTQLQPAEKNFTLLNIFQRYGSWLQRLGIDSVGALNDAIQESQIRKIVLVSEALHEQHIAELARKIEERSQELDVILIAGPSSSGKTTFAKRLTIQLLARGISPFSLEMDNYFVDRDKTPLDEHGEYNFEALEAVNRARLGRDLEQLIEGERVTLPSYDFQTGKSIEGESVQLRPGQIIILEGIHGLNPDLIPTIPGRRTFRIYISALTQLNLDRHNRVSTTDTRLIRRIVRDAWDRGYTAKDTIDRWESVRRGEKEYIFPYQGEADVMFNSALAYELSALKPLAEPLLRQVPHSTAAWIEAKRLLAFLEWFLPLEEEIIPENSILREFMGGSNLQDFQLWEQ